DDLVGPRLAVGETLRRRFLREHLLDLRIALALAVRAVGVIARARLLPVPAHFDDRIRHAIELCAVWRQRVLLANAIADVEPRHVHQRERSHGKTPGFERAVDIGGRRAFEQHGLRLFEISLDHAIADEAEAHTRDDTDLADPARDRH